MRLRSARVLGIAAIACLSAVAAGCTGGGDDAKSAKPSTTTTVPSDCVVKATPAGDDAGAEGEVATTSILQRCLDDAFEQAVADKGSSALKKMKAEEVLGFGHGLCAYAAALATNPEGAPTYDELVKSTSTSWNVDAAVFEEVLGLAPALCPGQLQPILDLRANAGAGVVEVELGASGSAPMEVAYTGPDGSDLTDTAQSPWTHLIRLEAASDVAFRVTATDGEVTCTLTVKGTQVKKATGDKDAPADCSATAAELRAAN